MPGKRSSPRINPLNGAEVILKFFAWLQPLDEEWEQAQPLVYGPFNLTQHVWRCVGVFRNDEQHGSASFDAFDYGRGPRRSWVNVARSNPTAEGAARFQRLAYCMSNLLVIGGMTDE